MSDRIDQLEKLLEAEPNDAFCLYGLAQEYAKTGDFERAVEFYERAIDADPDFCYAYFHMGRALEELDEPDRARATLERGLTRAKALGDAKATEEIQGFLDLL